MVKAYNKATGSYDKNTKSSGKSYNKSGGGSYNKSGGSSYNKSGGSSYNKSGGSSYNKSGGNNSSGGGYSKQDGIKFVSTEKRRRVVDDKTLNLRRLYNKIMQKKDKVKNKPETINKIIALMESKYKEYAYKHDGCRILQGCIKYGTKENRFEIISDLKEEIYALAIKPYAIYLAIKLWKYAENNLREELLKRIIKNQSKLLRSNNGQVFLNFVFNNALEKSQVMLRNDYLRFSLKIDISELEEIKQENINKNITKTNNENQMIIDDEVNNEENKEEKETTSNIIVVRQETFKEENFKENLKGILEKILEKQTHKNYIFQSSLSFIFDFLDQATKNYISELFDDDFENFFGSKPGVELGIKLISTSSTKTKKKIIKKIFQDKWGDSILANEFNYLLISKILSSTDDTKLSSKYVLKPLSIFVQEENFDFRVLIKVFHGILNPSRVSLLLDIANVDSSSKKDVNKMQTELFSSISDSIISNINVHQEKFLTEKSLSVFFIDFCNFLITELPNNDKDIIKSFESLVCNLLQYLEFDLKENSTEKEEKALYNKVAHFGIAMLTKKILAYLESNKYNIELNESMKLANKFIEKLAGLLNHNMNDSIFTKGAFLVVLILENEKYSNLVMKKVKENAKEMNDAIEKDNKRKKEYEKLNNKKSFISTTKAIEILVKVMNKK